MKSLQIWLWCSYVSLVVSVASPNVSTLCLMSSVLYDISLCFFVRFRWYLLWALVLFLSYGFYAMSYGLFAISFVSIVSPMGSPRISSKAFYIISFGLTRNIICFLWWFLWLLS